MTEPTVEAPDTAEYVEDPAVTEVLKVTKRGFNLKDRLEKRGLRRATVVLYLDEDKGAELGWDREVRSALGEFVGHDRQGVLGKIAELEARRGVIDRDRDRIVAAGDSDEALAAAASLLVKHEVTYRNELDEIESRLEVLIEEREVLIKDLSENGLTVALRAAPPVLVKDCARKARAHLGITEKGVPQDRVDEYVEVHTNYLVSLMAQSIKENATGEVNDGLSYEDVVDLRDLLPQSQWLTLDNVVGKIQYTDAISETLESQEDFS